RAEYAARRQTLTWGLPFSIDHGFTKCVRLLFLFYDTIWYSLIKWVTVMIHLERAPAKINLSLDILGKRGDGFHEVQMIMTAIDLMDRIQLTTLPEDRIEIAVDHQYVPNDE